MEVSNKFVTFVMSIKINRLLTFKLLTMLSLTNNNDAANQDFNWKEAPKEEKVFEVLSRGDLIWKVEKAPMTFQVGGETYPTDFFTTFRSDTKQSLGSVKEGFETYQNAELAELILEVAKETGCTFHNAGHFNSKRVFIQLENPEAIKGIGQNNDTIKRFYTAVNGHDGTACVRWGLSDLTISCQNTFWMNYRTLGNQFSVPHTQRLRDSIDKSLKHFELLQQREEEIYAIFKDMSEIPATKEHANEIAKIALFPKNDKAASKFHVGLTKGAIEEDFHGKSSKRIFDFLDVMQQEATQKGATLWGLFNAVTYFTTHKGGSDEKRSEMKAAGHLGKADNLAFQYLAGVSKNAERTTVANALMN